MGQNQPGSFMGTVFLFIGVFTWYRAFDPWPNQDPPIRASATLRFRIPLGPVEDADLKNASRRIKPQNTLCWFCLVLVAGGSIRSGFVCGFLWVVLGGCFLPQDTTGERPCRISRASTDQKDMF